MDKNLTKSVKFWYPQNNSHTIQYKMLQHNKTQVNLIIGQQAASGILDTRLYMHYLEYATKDHIAIHTILF